jgi:hypothetical protein
MDFLEVMSLEADEKPCLQAMSEFHKLWHDVVDCEKVSIVSGQFKLPDTEPPCSVVVIMASCETAHFEEIRKATHLAMAAKMDELYGKGKTIIQ